MSLLLVNGTNIVQFAHSYLEDKYDNVFVYSVFNDVMSDIDNDGVHLTKKKVQTDRAFASALVGKGGSKIEMIKTKFRVNI